MVVGVQGDWNVNEREAQRTKNIKELLKYINIGDIQAFVCVIREFSLNIKLKLRKIHSVIR